MRIARAQLDGATSAAIVFGSCVFALLATAGAVDANEPVTQSSPPDKVSSTGDVDTEQKSTPSPEASPKEKRKKKGSQLRRKFVVDFVGQHFPELQKSLLKVEKKSPSKFRHAVSRLENDIIRLRAVEQRNPAKFELLADLWKLKTQIEITIAKYAKKESNSQLEERLRPLAEEMLDIRTSIAKLERELAKKRISTMDERLLAIENDRDSIVERNLRSFKRSAEEIRAKKKAKSLERQSLKSEAKASSDSHPSEE